MLTFITAQEVGQTAVIQVEIALILGLVLVLSVALFVRRFKFPYTVALVFVGLLLAVISNVLPTDLPNIEEWISSELILALFVPPLVFEGALHINWKTFRENLVFILMMAVVGVLLSAFMVGGLVISLVSFLQTFTHKLGWFTALDAVSIPLMAAIAFGALISATDPVAVIAFFRSLGVDKRLATLMEGESLLNDGTSIVVFKIALVMGGVTAAGGSKLVDDFNILTVAWEFIQVSAGGILIGLAVGWITAWLLERTDDRLVETTLTIVAAFGAYLLAEEPHFSGILSVVAAGIYLGDTIPTYTSPTTKIALYNFWEVLSFIVTSLIFLMLGIAIDILQFFSARNLMLVAAGVVAVLAARLVIVYGMSILGNYILPAFSRLRGRRMKLQPVPLAYQHVIFWGGLRGAISLALALSLPRDAFQAGVGEQLRLMTYGVVLFTLLVQGTSIEALVKRLGLARRSPAQFEREKALGRYYAARAAMEELERLYRSGMISKAIWEAIKDAQQVELDVRDRAIRDVMHRQPGTSSDLALQARRLALQAERTALVEAVRREVISEAVQEDLVEELDAHLTALDVISGQAKASSAMDDIPVEQVEDE